LLKTMIRIKEDKNGEHVTCVGAIRNAYKLSLKISI
jgi:hypothetical protein